MGLSANAIQAGLDAIAANEPGIARAITIAGYPEARIRERGYATLLRTIVGQQVSVAAATTLMARIAEQYGEAVTTTDPSLRFLFPTAEQLRFARITGMPASRKRMSKGVG